MVHTSRKTIKGKTYTYAVQSVRLPNGKIRKLSKLIKNATDASGLKTFFEEKQIEAFVKYAETNYKPLRLHDGDALMKLERMRLEYKNIIKKLSAAQLKDLFDRFTVNFTYESNALEGNSLTLKEVAIVLYENATVKGKDLREVYETRNSRNVVDRILRKKFRLKETEVLKLHKMLVKDMGIASGYKKLPNYIQGRSIRMTPPETVGAAMDDLFEWFEKSKGNTHPLELAARFHGRFERIHPFDDGNGRVGRVLINIILTNSGYPPLIIRKTQRLSYFKALEESDKGRTGPLENFIYKRLKETHKKFFKVYIKYLQ